MRRIALGLLRARRERPRAAAPPSSTDEFAPPHTDHPEPRDPSLMISHDSTEAAARGYVLPYPHPVAQGAYMSSVDTA